MTASVTDRARAGHCQEVKSGPPSVLALVAAAAGQGEPAMPAVPEFDALYEEQFGFVWRSMRRLGVPERHLDDATQDAFVVVHRRLGDFEGRSSVRSWVFGIARRVAHDYRRHCRRKEPAEVMPAEQIAGAQPSPREAAERRESVQLLHELLDTLDDKKREVFVLAELEQMTAPEIADALEVNLNTIYSRLRGARREFNRAVARRQARDSWGEQR